MSFAGLAHLASALQERSWPSVVPGQVNLDTLHFVSFPWRVDILTAFLHVVLADLPFFSNNLHFDMSSCSVAFLQ